jgi:glycyl-tRNA synthetase beta chain
MVFEFPELQGTMGRYYALHDGEEIEVAAALDEQYQPRQAGDDLPTTMTGKVLAVADRLDTLAGIFAIGQPPTGDKDPFALRRAALGVLRILIEERLDLDLRALLECAVAGLPQELEAGRIVDALYTFMMERLRAYYADNDYDTDVFEAVLARRPVRPLDFEQRMQAVRAFRRLPESAALAAANKRIRNILRKADARTVDGVDDRLLREPAEQTLAAALQELEAAVSPLFAQRDYTDALCRLAALQAPVDRFFDEVMVMDDDEALRANRLALLDSLSGLFLGVADISRLRD